MKQILSICSMLIVLGYGRSLTGCQRILRLKADSCERFADRHIPDLAWGGLQKPQQQDAVLPHSVLPPLKISSAPHALIFVPWGKNRIISYHTQPTLKLPLSEQDTAEVLSTKEPNILSVHSPCGEVHLYRQHFTRHTFALVWVLVQDGQYLYMTRDLHQPHQALAALWDVQEASLLQFDNDSFRAQHQAQAFAAWALAAWNRNSGGEVRCEVQEFPRIRQLSAHLPLFQIAVRHPYLKTKIVFPKVENIYFSRSPALPALASVKAQSARESICPHTRELSDPDSDPAPSSGDESDDFLSVCKESEQYASLRPVQIVD